MKIKLIKEKVEMPKEPLFRDFENRLLGFAALKPRKVIWKN